ncbi:hypothetical protein Ngar_c02170 [Candidatus Nitrososphaera gargensis Ga9.2]|uniref:Uncharacterized protein n=1 Tax=Nitrososphaera gargensis (strain Ga9.2) TaxID=1237085 RepID=K0IC98_NITGG|nr:hypothetical protein Ngar_c02170 [Candidatus Nitrososphaera gargensis Ga9.2]
MIGATLFASGLGFTNGQQLATAQQQTEQQQNQTQDGNATTIANTTMTDTFVASGVITGTIQEAGGGQQTTTTAGNTTTTTAQSGNQTDNATQTAGGGTSTAPFLVGGDWTMNVESGNVTNFMANFTMVRIDGSEHHNHDITNFNVGNNTQFQLDPAGTTTINGTADYAVNGTSRWPGTDTVITIEKATVLTIQPQEQEAKDHFQGQPIYGIVLRATGENGTTITESVPAGGNQTQQQQEDGGGFLENLTRPFEDLFGGGG